MKKWISKISQIIDENIYTKKLLKHEITVIIKAVNVIIKSLQNGGKILLCGNGGSAADSQHLATEFVAKLNKKRKSIPAIALTTDTSLLTAVSNDNSFEDVFARQIEGIGKKGDVLIAISTSGNSKNILKAAKTANSMGIYTIGLTGEKMSKLTSMAKLIIKTPSSDTQRIQESHILIGHIICELVESETFKNHLN